MDTSKSFTDDGVLVPNHYELHLNPLDYEGFASYRTALEEDLSHGVLTRARRERYNLLARPRVTLVEDESTPRGDIRVAANLVDDRGSRVQTGRRVPGVSETRVFAQAEPVERERQREPQAARGYLLVSSDGQPPVQFELEGPLISLGRGSDNDLILDDPRVSRHHCQLRLQHGAFSLADLGSTNGSYVNGQRINEIALGPGDVIELGGTRIEFQVGE